MYSTDSRLQFVADVATIAKDFLFFTEPVGFHPERWSHACPKLDRFVWRMSLAHITHVVWTECTGSGWYRREIMRYKDALFQHWSTLERYHGPSCELSVEGKLTVTKCVFTRN